MKPKNRYTIPIGTNVYITTSIFTPDKCVVVDNIPIVELSYTGVWSTTKLIEFDEDDRQGHAAGPNIELFQLPTQVNVTLGLSNLVDLFLCVGKSQLMVRPL